ncbi:MAG: carboxylating nicotinate-nucleotide diphosphorylase [Bacteriovoracaceae bacterium]|nr:carboxylating nicotinate-nucleotide diphosphorylase [Bacteriovoracaceae bacterium]
MNKVFRKALRRDFEIFFEEDDLKRNTFYTASLPDDLVNCTLYFKSDLVVAGLPYFFEAFSFLGAKFSPETDELIKKYEGKKVKCNTREGINFQLPFSIALTGERIALNLLQHASSIATATNSFVELAKKSGVKILDTRKTTPGLRSLEKYAVRTGGGYNHRLGQTDVWMVKDNHKDFFGGLIPAVEFFKNMHGFYTPIEVEIHDVAELGDAIKLGVKHMMLDNFSPDQVREAIAIKPEGVTYEVSGGIRFETIENYLIEGVDAISLGAITYDAPHVDISLKYKRV